MKRKRLQNHVSHCSQCDQDSAPERRDLQNGNISKMTNWDKASYSDHT